MKTLYESLLGDMDDIIDQTTIYGFLDDLNKDKKNDLGKVVVNSDGSITSDHMVIYDAHIPKYIKFKGVYSIKFYVCTIEDVFETFNNGSNTYVTFRECVLSGVNRKLKNAVQFLELNRCEVKDLDWMPDDMNGLWLNHIDIDHIDLKGKKLKYCYLYSMKNTITISNMSVVYDNIRFVECPKLKSVGELKARKISLQQTPKLTDIKLIDGVDELVLDTSVKHLSPNILCNTITHLYAENMGIEWLEDTLKSKYPRLVGGKFPDPRRFKFNDNPLKIGDWVVVKGKSNSSIGYGSSRGTLMVDKVIKITDSRVKCNKAGIRPFIDVEPMKAANSGKNWKYVDPNGINDITGVGIEVGDKVVAYLPSGNAGKNNGLIVDEIVKLTKAGVKCKEAGNRRPYDICILRSQEECNKQFK